MNLRQMSLNMQTAGRGFLGTAAEAETRRRLIITALALERFRNRHGSYPGALSELAPELLASVPEDFMDGKPLRYRPESDGRFVLYSVGPDCVDNGGVAWERKQPMEDSQFGEEYRFRGSPDLVWPVPASDAEAERFQQEQKKAQTERLTSVEGQEAQDQWDRSFRRQAQVEKILSGPQPRPSDVPANLVDIVRGDKTSGTNKPSLADLLTLRRVTTGAEPEIVTFELPIKYDAVTNLGELILCIDFSKDEDSDEGFAVQASELERAPDGNSRLAWNTIYECEGKHALEAVLIIDKNLPGQRNDDEFASRIREFSGPFTTYTVTNLCQFSSSSAHFQRDYGVNLRARLQESNGLYNLDIKLPGGRTVQTLSGTTSNSLITVHWDLTDERGDTCTNDAFDTVFHINLPDSGRSQTLRGP